MNTSTGSSQQRVILLPSRHLAMSEALSRLEDWGQQIPLASRGWMSGMLLAILQSTGQPPIIKNYLSQDVNNAKAEKLWRGKQQPLRVRHVPVHV